MRPLILSVQQFSARWEVNESIEDFAKAAHQRPLLLRRTLAVLPDGQGT